MTTVRNHAVLVGVESRLLGELQGPPYAVSDVLALAEVLKELGYEGDALSVHVGDLANREAVESRIRSVANRLIAEPGRLFVYLAGAGFSRNGRNFLVCQDTPPDDPEGSALDLGEMLRNLRKARRSQVQIYLDCGRGDALEGSSASVGARSPVSEKMIERSLRRVEHVVVFGASRLSQRSFADARQERGIWAGHLIEALSGRAPEILTGRGILTDDALQNYLADRVPRTMRDTFTDRRKKQTPWRIGATETSFEVADVSPLLQDTAATRSPLQAAVKDIALCREERVRVKTLSGFKAGIHHLPRWTNHQAEQFVAKIALGEIEQDLSATFAEIRQNLTYRRKQIEVHPPGGGEASIRTPDFQYTVSVSLDEDPAVVVLTRELSDIRRPEILGTEGLAQTFDAVFDSVRLSFDRSIPVEELIDLAESHRLPVSYPHDCSSCTIRAVDGAIVRVSGKSLLLKYPGGQTLDQLTRGVGQLMRIMPNLTPLPPPAAAATRGTR